MPKRCALGCSTKTSYHQFPHPEKNPERFKAWVQIAGGKLDSPADYELYKKKVICDIHFTDRDRNRNNRLNFLAVPSLHLPGKSDEVGTSEKVLLAPESVNEESSLAVKEPTLTENYMENCEEYKTTGLVKQLRQMPNCMSTGFDCQASKKQTTASEVIQIPFEVSTPISPSVPQPTNIPIKQSFEAEECLIKDGDTCLKTDVLDTESDTIFCICCLEEDVSYVKVVTCEHAEFLYSLVMPEIKPKNQVICYQCHHMLKKIKLFKLQVEESFKLLSNSLETKPKHTNQRHNFKVRQNFNINIPKKETNMERPRVYTEVPQFRTKYYKDHDGNITEEVIESIDTTEKRPKPRSPDKLTKKSKNIEEALKIINSNQNSDCISVLTNSLKNISSTLLSDFFINFAVGSDFDKAIPETNEENNITATLKKQIIDAKEKHTFQNDASHITSKLAITTENLAKFLGENSSKTDATNIAKNLTQGNLTTKIAEALIEDSIKTSTDLKSKIKNSINNTTSTVISKENLINNTEEGTTNNYNENKHLTLEGIGKDLLLPKVNPKIDKKTSENPVQKDPVSKTDEIIGRIKTEHYAMVENDSSGDLSQTVTEKESVGVEKEKVGHGEICPAVESTIALDTQPSLGSNIKQLTLTRTQLIDERIKTATSQAYLRAPHRCTSCLIGFQFQENLEDHVKRKHTEGKIQAVECDICYQLVDPSGYEMHKFWHLTRYQCVACEQLFASYDRAAFHYKKQHVKKHNKEKPTVVFRCPRCTYKTSRRRLLKHHLSECRPSSTDVTLDTSLTNTAEAPSEPKRAKFLPTATG